MGSHRKISILHRCNHFLEDTGIISKPDTFFGYKLDFIFPKSRTTNVSETEDYKLTTGATEQACDQKLNTYILQNISTTKITLIT